MAKRFTATEKWDDPWFFELDAYNKLVWIFILDKCNHAGIWNVNHKLLEFYTGSKFVGEAFKGRIQVINPQKWFIPKFIEFQYGTLNPLNRLHQSVISILRREGVYEKEGLSKDLISPSQGAKDKDKDKVKEQVQVKEKENIVLVSKAETPLQKVVKGWKMLNDIPLEGPDSQMWDRVHFARCAKSAKSLLDLFGFRGAIECMEFVYNLQKEKRLDCTLETVVKRSDLFRENLARSGQ